MGFLKDSNNNQSVYLEVKQEPSLVRPLASKPQSVWVHKIQEIRTSTGGQTTTLRKFAYETCTANGRSGSGCHLCSTQDPLWHMLPTDEQTNRAGKRVDFPKTPIHLLPVFNHTTQQAEIMKGGNQIFSEMDKWYDQQPDQQKDLRRCDWRVWKTGEKKSTKYSSIRLDASAFEITKEMEDQAKNALAQALRDRNPTEAHKLASMISGGGESAGELGSGAVPTPSALPASTSVGPAITFTAHPTPVVAPVLPVVAQTVASAPVANVTAPAGSQASKANVDTFTAWVQSQPEFQAMGLVTTLLPMIKSQIGHADYYKLSADQLTGLQANLAAQLDAKRAGK